VVLGISNTDGATVTGVERSPPRARHLLRVWALRHHLHHVGHQAGSGHRGGSAGTATATSPAFTAPATGTYCFLGVYSGDGNYAGGSDASTGECFTVTVAPPGVAHTRGAVPWCSASPTPTVPRSPGWERSPHGHRHLLRVWALATTCTTSGTKLGVVTVAGSAGTATATSPLHGAGHRHLLLLGRLLGRRQLPGGSDASTGECFTVTVAPPG